MPEAYLQAANGQEAELEVTLCEPDDGSFVLHLNDSAFGLLVDQDCWVRFVPDLPKLNDNVSWRTPR